MSKQNRIKLATLKAVLTSTLAGLIAYYLLGYGFAPSQFILEEITGLRLIYFIVVDQFLIETLYIFLLLKSLEIYLSILRIDSNNLKTTFSSLKNLYLVSFLGLIFFFINPITQSLRYIIRHGLNIEWHPFLNEYLFNSSLYVIYTVLGSLIGITCLLIRIFKTNHSSTQETITRLVGEHNAVMKPVEVDEIHWIEVKERKYWVVTEEKELRITKTISELEKELDKNTFVRINRSIIINSKRIESYCSWGNGTYLIEMKTPFKREFSVSRNRVKEFKRVMKV